MSIHCDANKRLGNCKAETLTQAGDEMFKLLAQVEQFVRQRRPVQVEKYQGRIESSLNRWTEVKNG